MTKHIDPKTLRALPVAERLELIEVLWDSLGDQRDEIPLLDWHMGRLQQSCGRLHIPLNMPVVREELDKFQHHVAQFSRECVIKLIVTRGPGERGYRSRTDAVPTRVLQHFLPAGAAR